MSGKAVIFGSNGQDGYYLKRLVEANGLKCLTVSRASANMLGDVSDFQMVSGIIQREIPDFVFHLAAVSNEAHSFIFENHSAISTGALNILEAVRLYAPYAKVFLSGSGLQFKNVGLQIDENSPFELNSIYSVARIHSVLMSRYFRDFFGVNVYVGYLFNHDSPIRSERYLCQKVAQTAVKIKLGFQSELVLENMGSIREFAYASDIVEGIWFLVNQEESFEAVIGTGIGYSLLDWIERCFDSVKVDWRSHVSFKIEQPSARPALVSRPVTINNIGWYPRYSIDKFAEVMVAGAYSKISQI